MDFLIDFIEKCDCFEPVDKLKLILFAAKVKPATFVPLKISPKNISDKFHFEKHLKNFVFKVDLPNSFEEISSIKNNKIIWSIKGVWYGYDLFKDKKYKTLFKKYVHYVRRHKILKADLIAGKLYGYPSCCVKNFIKEKNLDWLKNKYSYYSYYKKLHDCERRFPFIFHTPCSVKCASSKSLNTRHRNTIKKLAPRLYKEFSKKKSFATDFIVEGENNIMTDIENRPLWIKKDGHEYNLVAKKKFDGKQYLISYLTRDKEYLKGSLLKGKAIMQNNYADVKITKLKKIIPNLIHVRKFKLLGRKY